VNKPRREVYITAVIACLAAVCFSLLLSTPSSAQVAGATLTGTITDQSKAVLPNVQVTITNADTGITVKVTSDSAGVYSATNLTPGRYDIVMRAKGFQTVKRSGLTLTVGQQLTMNDSMAVGSATETVNVSVEAPTINLSNSTVSGTVEENTVRELPLNGRDWTTLAVLQPGVNSLASIQSSSSVTSFSRGNRGLGFQMSISGARPQLNAYRIDGIVVNDYANGGPGSVQGGTLGADAIQEYSVLTSNYTAEYGRTAGGVINAVTRPGTNKFHGSAYEFLRNSALDAANYFDNFTGVPKPPFKQNQFGGAIGGPIRRDKTFFFGNYEGLRISQSTTILANVPSPAADQGILNFPGGPGTYPTGCVQTATANQCAVSVSSLVQPYLALWAPPNAGLLADGNTGLYSFPGKQGTIEDFATGRVDHRFSASNSIYGSTEYDHSRLTLPDDLNDIQNLTISTRVLIAAEETYTFSPRLVNTVRAGYSRAFAEAAPSVPVNAAAGNLALGPATGYGTPNISVSGLSLAEGAYGIEIYKYPYNSFQYSDDAFYVKGSNAFKFGFVLERDQENSLFLPGPSGTFQFSTLANFLTDQPRSIRTGSLNGTPRGWRQTVIGTYLQDNYQFRPNLTVNLGLRYEMSTVLSEVHNKEVSLHEPTDPAPTVGAPLMSNPTLKNFDPRIGFAYDPFKDGKTSIRAGFGVFDVLPLLSFLSFADNQSAPFNVQGNASNLPPNSFPVAAFALAAASSQLRTAYIQQHPSRSYVMTWNLSLERQITPSLSAFVGYVGSHGIREPFAVDDMNIVLPTKTAIGYLWPNPVGSGTVLNSGGVVSRIDGRFFNNSTTFHALEAEVTKEMSHGFRFQGSYTYSKALDDGDGINIGDPFNNSISSLFFFDPKLRKGLADFNVAQNLTVNYGWNLPSAKSLPGPLRTVVGGWELGGIITARTGLPFTPNLAGSGNGANGDPLGLNNSDPFDYPNRITTGGCSNPTNSGNVTNYFKLNCFTLPTAPNSYASACADFTGATAPAAAGSVYCSNLLGNLSRNSVIGPGLVNVDFSIFKNFPIPKISEPFNIQFRTEFFNVLNHANFNSPIDNSNIFDVTGAPIAGAGLIDSTSTPAREIQFGLKIIF
jgi:Carboxypeptidase regulatory-like domain/TonB dependent receptor/TonB-dependent Receptor Plug Domain